MGNQSKVLPELGSISPWGKENSKMLTFGYSGIPMGKPSDKLSLAQVVPAILELRRSGLTIGDIARLFGVHTKAVESILDSEGCAERRDLRKEVPG